MHTVSHEILVDDNGETVGYVHKGQFYALKDSNNYWGKTGGWHICTECGWSGYTSVNDKASGYERFCPECNEPFWDEKKSSKWVNKNPWDNTEIDIDSGKKWKPKDWNCEPWKEERRAKDDEEAMRRAHEIDDAIKEAKKEAAEEAKEIEKAKKKAAQKRAALKKKRREAREKKAVASKQLPSVPSVTGEHARKINWN